MGRHPKPVTVSDIARVGSATVNTVQLMFCTSRSCKSCALAVAVVHDWSRTHAEAGETLAGTVAKARRVR